MSSRRASEAWNDFWFARIPTTSLALFRIAFALVLLCEIPVAWRESLFSIDGEGFRLPYWSAIPHVPPAVYEWLFLLQLPALVLLAIGAWTRSACSVLVLLQGWLLFADQLSFRNHPYFFWLLLVLSTVSPAGAALGLDARRNRDGDAIGARRPRTVQRMMQLQVCFVYFFAGLQKINPAFLGGDVIAHSMQVGLRPTLLGGAIEALAGSGALDAIVACAQLPWITRGLAAGTIAFELILPLALWHPRTRIGAICVGAVFHLTLALVMDVWTFSLAMLASYLLFADPQRVASFVRARVTGGRPAA